MTRTQADCARRARNYVKCCLTRRQALAGAAVATLGAVAGCGRAAPDSSGDRSHAVLHQTPTYVADGVDLTVPEEIPTVNATNNADLLVLPGDTDVEAQRAVDWLAADRAVALLGDGAERTWIAWARSDAYAETFDDRGFGDSEPDPQLLVGAAVGPHVSTYRHTWGNGPSDRDVLRALDEDLADIEAATPRSRRDGSR